MSLSKKSQDLILDLINAANPQMDEQLSFDIIEFDEPAVNTDEDRNTAVLVSAKADTKYAGEVTVKYDRLDIQKLFTDAGYPIVEVNAKGILNSTGLLAELNETWGLALDEDDIVAEALPTELPADYTLKIKPTSFAWLGELTMKLGDGKPQLSEIIIQTVLDGLKYPTGDVSDLIRPVLVFNSKVSNAFTEEAAGLVLNVGDLPNEHLIVVNNAELENAISVVIDGETGLAPTDGAIPSYVLEVGADKNWSFVLSSGLIDTSKGAALLGLYRVQLTVETLDHAKKARLQLAAGAEPGSTVWKLVDDAGVVGAEVALDAAFDGDGNLFVQGMSQALDLGGTLVEIPANAVGAALGDFYIALEGRRLDSIAPRVLAQVNVKVTGVEAA